MSSSGTENLGEGLWINVRVGQRSTDPLDIRKRLGQKNQRILNLQNPLMIWKDASGAEVPEQRRATAR